MAAARQRSNASPRSARLKSSLHGASPPDVMTFASTANLHPQAAALQQRLVSADAGVRRVALREFADLEDEALLPAIASVLRHDPDPTLRVEAARALAGGGGAEGIDALA